MIKSQNPTFQKLQPEISEKICQYATTNQLEMTACDLTKRILDNTSRETLQLNGNFTQNSPYKIQNIFSKIFSSTDNLEDLLKNTWNGILK